MKSDTFLLFPYTRISIQYFLIQFIHITYFRQIYIQWTIIRYIHCIIGIRNNFLYNIWFSNNSLNTLFLILAFSYIEKKILVFGNNMYYHPNFLSFLSENLHLYISCFFSYRLSNMMTIIIDPNKIIPISIFIPL